MNPCIELNKMIQLRVFVYSHTDLRLSFLKKGNLFGNWLEDTKSKILLGTEHRSCLSLRLWSKGVDRTAHKKTGSRGSKRFMFRSQNLSVQKHH